MNPFDPSRTVTTDELGLGAHHRPRVADMQASQIGDEGSRIAKQMRAYPEAFGLTPEPTPEPPPQPRQRRPRNAPATAPAV